MPMFLKLDSPDGEGHASVTDGTSNTLMFAEKFARQDGEYVLTSTQHWSQPGFVGGVFVASGDVNPDTDALGQTITFTATVNTSASDYSGSHAIYQDVFIPAV